MEGLGGWVVGVVESLGLLGVGALVALESVVPPVPSEVVLPFAGFSASRGAFDPVLAWLAATLGALAGALLLYAVGARVGRDRLHALAHRRWFVLVGPRDLARGERLFQAHGDLTVLVGRWVPFVRSVVSLPAGATRMPLHRFALLTTAGSGAWNAVFLLAGYQLGARWEDVGGWTRPVGWVVTAALVAAVAWLAVRRARGSADVR